MDGIAVISGQRTGAGHLFRVMENFAEIAARADLFADGFKDGSGLIDLAELEARGAGKRVLALKATSLLPRDFVEASILSRPGMRVIFVVRRQIDAYVSLAKATALDVWQDFDTTAVKVKLDAARFALWMEAEAAWYRHWFNWLERRSLPAPVLRYETHLSVPAEAALRRFATAAEQVGISLKVPANIVHRGLTAQDNGKAAAFKVKNWPEFSKALVDAGLERQAFGYPI